MILLEAITQGDIVDTCVQEKLKPKEKLRTYSADVYTAMTWIEMRPIFSLFLKLLIRAAGSHTPRPRANS